MRRVEAVLVVALMGQRAVPQPAGAGMPPGPRVIVEPGPRLVRTVMLPPLIAVGMTIGESGEADQEWDGFRVDALHSDVGSGAVTATMRIQTADSHARMKTVAEWVRKGFRVC